MTAQVIFPSTFNILYKYRLTIVSKETVFLINNVT